MSVLLGVVVVGGGGDTAAHIVCLCALGTYPPPPIHSTLGEKGGSRRRRRRRRWVENVQFSCTTVGLESARAQWPSLSRNIRRSQRNFCLSRRPVLFGLSSEFGFWTHVTVF